MSNSIENVINREPRSPWLPGELKVLRDYAKTHTKHEVAQKFFNGVYTTANTTMFRHGIKCVKETRKMAAERKKKAKLMNVNGIDGLLQQAWI